MLSVNTLQVHKIGRKLCPRLFTRETKLHWYVFRTKECMKMQKMNLTIYNYQWKSKICCQRHITTHSHNLNLGSIILIKHTFKYSR